MSDDAFANITPVAQTVRKAVLEFFHSLGRDVGEINDDTNLIRGTGASSDEGVDFAIDLSDVIGVEVPHDFNPFVHPSGERGMKLRELVEHCEQFLAAKKGVTHGG